MWGVAECHSRAREAVALVRNRAIMQQLHGWWGHAEAATPGSAGRNTAASGTSAHLHVKVGWDYVVLRLPHLLARGRSGSYSTGGRGGSGGVEEGRPSGAVYCFGPCRSIAGQARMPATHAHRQERMQATHPIRPHAACIPGCASWGQPTGRLMQCTGAAMPRANPRIPATLQLLQVQ